MDTDIARRYTETERASLAAIAVTVTVLSWFQTSVSGASRVLTAVLAGAAALVGAALALQMRKER
ncbi:hypothetical protein G9464_00145 [Halostella sp. JP-L12]|uniref:hypothetical protein n=1 Tax=Halostella TaxID=1843185 RepID=UPI000EF7CA1D|nr:MULTISPECIES: hypothetical protein [Halostella]NHN46006.1 hypothetical protein [Halostella sp. JP-L12]